jgi:flagellin
MSLRINHNLAALNAHRNLLTTTESLSQSMQRLSSGFRINKGSDDPAGLVISEQFRAQIAGLNRAIQNSEGSINMIQTAEGALTEINNLLISMRELAIHAANEGFNDADQLAADQAEIDNAIKTIDRIAANTQFGSKKLLDGSNANTATITSSNSSLVTIRESFLSNGTHSITATKTADATATLNTTSLGLSLASTTGVPTNLTEKIHNVDVVQASDVAKKRSGSVSLADAFGNNLTLAAAASVAMISSGNIATATASNAGNYTFTINYQENGESPTGNQTFVVAVIVGDTTATIASKLQTQINLNTAMAGKVVVTGTAAGALRIKSANLGAQYSIQTQASSTTATQSAFSVSATSSRGISANVLNFTVTSATQSNTTANVTVAANTYSSMTALATAIDTAMDTAFGKVAGATSVSDFDVSVFNTTMLEFHSNDEGSAYSIKMNTGAAGTGNLKNVLKLTDDAIANTGVDSLVSFDNYTNTINKVNYASTSTVSLKNAADGSASQGTISMVVGTALNGINLGNLLLDVKAARFDVRLNGGPATSVVAGKETVIFNADRSESLKLMYGLGSQGGTETISNFDRSLVFQIGANVGQTANIGMRNMSASRLGTGIAGISFSSLAQINVTTVQGAQDAQSVIDAAINEVSTTRGTLGSFQKNTLESNLRNLRVAAQNLTASESQIRDTDMASEMSEFTKNQILLQAGTAMLAQANQVPQVVLSLFA